MSVWQHIFPPFDAWWPNIVAAVLWGAPAGAVAVWRSVVAHRSRRALHEKLDAIHAHLGISGGDE